MPAAELPFSREEYARRLARVRRAMTARNIDVLFIEDPSNMAWITGYDGWSFYVHQGVLVFHDADPVWWGRSQDVHGAIRTVWMRDDRAHGDTDGTQSPVYQSERSSPHQTGRLAHSPSRARPHQTRSA